MSDWITDRMPVHPHNGTMVYGPDGNICHWTWIKNGDAWKPIPPCEPYVKPKPWVAVWSERFASWKLDGPNYQHLLLAKLTDREAHAEAAERIAEIYNGVTS